MNSMRSFAYHCNLRMHFHVLQHFRLRLHRRHSRQPQGSTLTIKMANCKPKKSSKAKAARTASSAELHTTRPGRCAADRSGVLCERRCSAFSIGKVFGFKLDALSNQVRTDNV
jgi:hypothetical protein